MLSIIFGIITWLMRLTIIPLVIKYIVTGQNFWAFVYAFYFLLTLAPIILNFSKKMKIHWFYDFLFNLVIFVHVIGMEWFYDYFFYDDLLHFFSSGIIAFGLFMFYYTLNDRDYIKVSLPMIGFLALVTSVAIAAYWEIGEFLWDIYITIPNGFQRFAQDSLVDTMSDLIWNNLASTLAAVLSVYVAKKKASRKGIKKLTKFKPKP